MSSFNTKAQDEGGYANKFSVQPGDSIEFHTSTISALFDINILMLDDNKNLIETIRSIKGGIRLTKDSAAILGCDWPVSITIKIPITWHQGVYLAEFPTSSGNKNIIFRVASDIPGKYSKIVISLPINTWQAYNTFGGYSFYRTKKSLSDWSRQLSFSRPYSKDKDEEGSGEYFRWADHLVKWLTKEKIPFEFTDNIALYNDPDILSNYKILILVGHDEYMSRPERLQMESFVKNGGKIIILSGNTCWLQIRYGNNQRTIYCYRRYYLDPEYKKADSLVTVEWNQYPVNYPENSLTGVSWRNGGYVTLPKFLPVTLGYGGYTAYNNFKWIYQGTNINEGEVFGIKDAIVGHETDGCLYSWENGIPRATGTDKTPKNFTILGISPAANPSNGSTIGRQATMGIYFTPGNGAVFNASSLNWVKGLASDTTVQIITKNIIRRYLSNQFPPEIISWGPFRVQADSINQEKVFLNKRSVAIPSGKSRKFFVKARDYFKEPLKYLWALNGNVVSTDTAFSFTSDSSNHIEKDLITVYVFNSHDTSSIQWNVFTKPIKIVSKPPKRFFSLKEQFYYKLESAAFYQDTVKYTSISLPKWLNLNQEGLLSGSLSEKGIYQVTVRAEDSFNNFDVQNFTINVDSVATITDSIQVINPLSFVLSQNYPNPFNPTTNILFEVKQYSFISLEVFDILGQIVSTLLKDYKSPGKYQITFNASHLASGVYIYRLLAVTKDGKTLGNYSKKMLLLR